MSPPIDDLSLARTAGERAAGARGVAGLDGGLADAFATYRRGQRVVGVRLDTDAEPLRVAVRVRASSPDALPGIGERVRAAVTAGPPLARCVVDVHVSDVDVSDVDVSDVDARRAAPPVTNDDHPRTDRG